jgi:hypothetical protein
MPKHPKPAFAAALSEREFEAHFVSGQGNLCEADTLWVKKPLLAELYGASASGRVATGPRAAHRISKMGDETDVDGGNLVSGLRCASVSGVNVHANVCLSSHGRMRLERLCRNAGIT